MSNKILYLSKDEQKMYLEPISSYEAFIKATRNQKTFDIINCTTYHAPGVAKRSVVPPPAVENEVGLKAPRRSKKWS